jgi:hypothetical protein
LVFIYGCSPRLNIQRPQEPPVDLAVYRQTFGFSIGPDRPERSLVINRYLSERLRTAGRIVHSFRPQ